MAKHRVTFEVDTSKLFEGIKQNGDLHDFGFELVTPLLTPDDVTALDTIRLQMYGVSLVNYETGLLHKDPSPENTLDVKLGEWWFRVRPTTRSTKHKLLAWCAKTPDLGDDPLNVAAVMDCHFTFGDSVDAVMATLKAEVQS